MSIDRRRSAGFMPLRDAMDRLFEGSYVPGMGASISSAFPPTDMHATDNEIVVSLAVPGARPDDIQISVTGETVTISGEIHDVFHRPLEGQQRSRTNTYFEEIWTGRFQRSFSLPFDVDANRADATYDNGILTLVLPKSEAAKPHRIQVRSGRGGQGASGGESNTIEGNAGEGTETIPVQGE